MAIRSYVPRNPSLYETDTNVRCPVCQKENIAPRFSCISVGFYCPACRADFSMADLFKQISEEDFETLSDMISHRYSDRI